ncbi:glycosyltransferase [Vibrio parahaemolyticus]|uniref:glycosyltransferase n=1 Tax=Vibrio parahaemolyticus TaxID=670 RepID=UPI0003FB479E|nr:glycosyltransferase [Vibrio parahaemolyticus]
MKKVIELFVYSLQDKRGTENATYSLAKGLANFYDVRVISLLKQDEVGVLEGICTSSLNISSKYKIVVYLRFLFCLLFKHEIKNKIVISSSPYITTILIIFRSYISNLITIEHAPYIHFNNKFNFLRRKIYKYIDYVVCLSKEECAIFNDFSNSILLPNFIIPHKVKESYKKKKKQGFNIAFLGRFSPEKGGERFIRFAEYFLERNQESNVNFYMIGDGPLLSHFKEIIEKSKYKENIFLYPPIKNVQEVSAIIDANFVCSDYESFGLTIVEFMMLGKPTFSFDIDNGPRNIISDSYNGYLASKYDFEKMSKVIENHLSLSDSETNEMKQNCISSFKKYDYRNAYSYWRELID